MAPQRLPEGVILSQQSFVRHALVTPLFPVCQRRPKQPLMYRSTILFDHRRIENGAQHLKQRIGTVPAERKVPRLLLPVCLPLRDQYWERIAELGIPAVLVRPPINERTRDRMCFSLPFRMGHAAQRLASDVIVDRRLRHGLIATRPSQGRPTTVASSRKIAR